MTIEEDGLRWLAACYGRGVDAFNGEDMLRAYEAGRAHPSTAGWKIHREGWFGGPTISRDQANALVEAVMYHLGKNRREIVEALLDVVRKF